MVINPIVGVYIPIIRIPIKGGRSPIPNIATFDHGTYSHDWLFPHVWNLKVDHRFAQCGLSIQPVFAGGRDRKSGCFGVVNKNGGLSSDLADLFFWGCDLMIDDPPCFFFRKRVTCRNVFQSFFCALEKNLTVQSRHQKKGNVPVPESQSQTTVGIDSKTRYQKDQELLPSRSLT